MLHMHGLSPYTFDDVYYFLNYLIEKGMDTRESRIRRIFYGHSHGGWIQSHC